MRRCLLAIVSFVSPCSGYDVVAAVCGAADATERMAIVNHAFGRAGTALDIDYPTIFEEVTCATNAAGTT